MRTIADFLVGDRQRLIVSKELEKLLEKGAINDDDFSSIHDLLPQEWSLRGGPPATSAAAKQAPESTSNALRPTLPIRNNSHQSAVSASSAAAATEPTPPASVSGPEPERASTPASAGGGGRGNGHHTVVGYATAKYKYEAPNEGDVAFERGEAVAVYSKVNDDWWLGRNERSGRVGIFPRQYVKPDAALADLERSGRMPSNADEPPAPPAMPSRPQQGGQTAYADSQRGYGSGPGAAPPPSYYDQYGQPPSQQQQQQQAYYGGHEKFGQFGQQPPYQYGQQPGQQQYMSPQGPPPQQQQQQDPNQPQKPGMGKKVGGKLGNAFVAGVGFAAGAELVGAIL